jgi:hypothetical protein
MLICSRTQDWPACVKLHAADHTKFKFQFSAGCVTELTIVRTIRYGGLTSGRRPVVKIIAESLLKHDEKHVVPTPLNVGKGRKKSTIRCVRPV